MVSYRSFISYTLVFFIFIAVFWGVTYTADWVNYESFFTGKQESRDIGFAYLTDVFNNLDAEYQILFRFHIVLMAAAYLLFFSRIRASAWIIAFYVVINYVALGNQIRYYVALPLTFLALYEFVIKRNSLYYLLFTVVSVLMHFSILVFQLCFFLVYYLSLYFRRSLLSVIIVVNIVGFFLLMSGLGFQERYVAYLSEDRTSTWIGGLYNILPSLISILCLLMIRRYIDLEKSFICYDDSENVASCYDDYDEVFDFLFVLSVSTSLLILPSLQMQILCNRFIFACLPVWLAFGIMGFSCSVYYRWRIFLLLLPVVILPILWTFVFPFVFGIDPHFIVEAVLMIESYEF